RGRMVICRGRMVICRGRMAICHGRMVACRGRMAICHDHLGINVRYLPILPKVISSNLPSKIAPIVAAARCFVSIMGMQRLQRIAGRRWDEKRI
ncbi:MAG: hypothetical protein WCL14_12540, partial [Bacteroidota bacterium]